MTQCSHQISLTLRKMEQGLLGGGGSARGLGQHWATASSSSSLALSLLCRHCCRPRSCSVQSCVLGCQVLLGSVYLLIHSFLHLLSPSSVPGIQGAASWWGLAFRSGSWQPGLGHSYWLYVTPLTPPNPFPLLTPLFTTSRQTRRFRVGPPPPHLLRPSRLPLLQMHGVIARYVHRAWAGVPLGRSCAVPPGEDVRAMPSLGKLALVGEIDQ